MIQASTMSDPFAITYQPLLCVIHVFFFMTSGNSLVQGANERDLNTDKSWIEVLKFMPEGRDFYQKYLKQSKPVAFRGAFQSRIMENATENIERLVQKERFASNGKKMMFSHWYNQSMSEEKELDLRANESLLMDEIALPLMLHCKEYRVVYDHFMLTIIPHITHNYPKQIDNEMMLFSFENRIKIELYDSKYSAELLTNMEIGQTFLEDAVTHATISKGDIIYVPKYWWIKTETLGVPKLAFKIFFNILEGEAQKCATEEQKVDKLQYIKGYKQFLNKQPASIDCSRRSLSLRHVLLINESDPKTLQLRLPKKVEQPHDATLRSGFTMPVLGLGTALLNEKTSGIVKQALDLGYRLIDTAQGYPGSEAGIAQALIESSVPRSEIFIVSKLHPRFLGFDSTLKAIEMSLKSLKVDYIDLFLIHSKECDEFLLQCEQGEPYGTWKESWKAMEYAHRAGKIRSLGVSNFKVFDLIELEKLAQIPVSVVQNWFDPIHQDLRIRKFCSEKNIRYMGYSTLGGMWTVLGLDKNPILTSSLLTDLSTHYDYFVSSLVLSWALYHNVTVIPRTTNRNHLAQNLRALDMKLSEADISEIDTMATIFDEVLQDMQSEERQEAESANGGSNPSDQRQAFDSHDRSHMATNINQKAIYQELRSTASTDIEEPIISKKERK